MSLYSRSAAALLVSLRTFVQVGRAVAPRGDFGSVPEAPEKWVFAGLFGAWLTSDGGGV